jgi:hypothetical protein
MSDPQDSYPNEERRWMRVLGIPALFACIFMAAAIGTGIHWLIVFCLIFGPGVGVLSIIFLAISSDTNGGVDAAARRARVATGNGALRPRRGAVDGRAERTYAGNGRPRAGTLSPFSCR